MESMLECVIAGGPQHGDIRRLEWDAPGRMPQAILSIDGEMCIAAARRNGYSRLIYLHPSVTGAQIMTLLTAENDGSK